MKTLVRTLILGIIFCWIPAESRSQTSAGETASAESRYIVDMPTAGVVGKGRYAIDGYAFGNSGVLAEFTASPLVNLHVGISYGGSGFLGNGPILLQALPGFHIRYRAFDETVTVPAFTIGLSTQGRGEWLGDRFQTHSPGIFIAASKNFSFLGTAALHAGINYSFESVQNRVPNLYIGFEKTLGSVVSLTGEYNPSFNDSDVISRGGLLNFGLRVGTGRGFTIELQVRDIFRTLSGAPLPYRLVRAEFTGSF
jgi:hypothetical protein